ncbi:hypothetical protein EJ02DRAFT_460520 [Clathrospora elynae]|uniref:Uncharacterized protein n=1 Tax=Clathrospora elynae TaxID=706981 RepID=A0A6A5SA42_9PLEO|nr:hypothetical protein EJ02DRAFT_460520 [Clathrospora elynae]
MISACVGVGGSVSVAQLTGESPCSGFRTLWCAARAAVSGEYAKSRQAPLHTSRETKEWWRRVVVEGVERHSDGEALWWSQTMGRAHWTIWLMAYCITTLGRL